MRTQPEVLCNHGIMIGVSQQMQCLNQQIERASRGTYAVVIRGETGTGKELVARAIHFGGASRKGPFIPVDCPSITPSLFESELFGHVKGAFTGAISTTKGLMEAANGGTLFLDEVGDLPLALQPKLLRALQENAIRLVGSNSMTSLKLRLLSATNCNLEKAMSEGTFRQDLFFRLKVLEVDVPPLRHRQADIPLLAGYFVQKFSGSSDGSWTISDNAMELLAAYDWPGNVRELEHAVESAVAFCSESRIQAEDLPSSIRRHKSAAILENSRLRTLEEEERRMIVTALARNQGNRIAAARALGIGKTTLYRKLKQPQAQTVLSDLV